MVDGAAISERRIGPADWEAAVRAVEGPQLVVGGPGTGKTEFLVRRAVHLLAEGVPPEALLLLSFSRRGVADLKDRVASRLGRSFTVIQASTFHSLASRLLEAHAPDALGWATLPSLLTGPEQVALVRELLASEDPDGWSPAYRPILGTLTFAREVTDFLLRCQEQLIGPDQLEEAARTRADWRGLGPFLSRYHRELKDRHRIDYGTLLAQAVRLLDRPEVVAAVGHQYRYVLTDEYQDTTTAQARFLQRLYAPHRNLTAAADPYQSIYSFRGTELHNVEEFPADFPAEDGTPAQRLVLTISFRVPAAVLDAAVRVTAGIDLPGAAGPVTPAQGAGSVETYVFGQSTEEAEWIAAEAQRLHLEQGLAFCDMAVLVRSKRRFLPELSRTLERRGIPHDSPDARLADHPAVRVVLDCVVAATEGPEQAQRAVRRVLLGPLFRLPLGELRGIERARLAGGLSWPQAIRTGLPEGEALAALLEDPAWATNRPADQGFWHLWSTLPQFAGLVADPARRAERAAWGSLSQVLGRLHERDPEASLRDYLRWAEDDDFEATPLLGFRRSDEDRLTLTTLHQSKGLEFEVVFIADAVEGVFPDLRPRESLLGSRHLSPTLPTDPAAYHRFRIQEETRLAYTAMVRSRRRVVWTATASGFEEGQGSPSRFLALVAGTPDVASAGTHPPVRTVPITTLEAEAWLRRIAGDPSTAAPRRLAALHLLAGGSAYGLRSPLDFAGTAEPGPDTGLVPPDARLSPSQAEAYENCPRRYAFERRLRVGDEPSLYLTFGSLIHRVLCDAESAAQDRSAAHATLEEALAALQAAFEPGDFGGPPWADSWRRRAVDTLTHLYGHWPGSGVPVALERSLTLERAGFTWLGRADRIEARDTTLAVVDYKTSKRAQSKEEAARSLQLGFYLLACEQDSELAGRFEHLAAELWFPSITDTQRVVTRDFDVDDLDAIGERLDAAAAGIRAEDWPALPGDGCRTCRVRLVCPQWPEGREAFAG